MCTFMIIPLLLLLRIRNVLDTFMLCNLPPLPPEIRAVYEIMWKNIVDPGRSQMTMYEGLPKISENFLVIT